MKRIMLGITLRNRMINPWIRQQMQIVDIMKRIAMKMTGLIIRKADERWTKRVMKLR